MQKIRRKKTVEGICIPSIVKNGSYFYNALAIYDDGMIGCWKLVDLAGFEECLNNSWVVTNIPSGQNISVGFGSFKIISAIWTYDKESFLQRVKDTLKIINPDLANIYRVTSEEKQRLEDRRLSIYSQQENFYVKQECFYDTAKGENIKIFCKYNGENHLVELVVYEDGKVICYNNAFEVIYDIKEIKSCFEDGIFFTRCETETKININGLGELIVKEDYEPDNINDKYTELIEKYNQLQGKQTLHDKCKEAYYDYLEYPSEYGKKRLKELYEQIPENKRMYLGDMDCKDYDYRRIIYTDKKREV